MAFKEHPSFVPPGTGEYKMWRYMDFTKLVSMLARRSLYFTSLKKMSEQDAFEGRLPDKYFQYRSWKTVGDVPEHERWRLTLHSRTGASPLEMAKSSMEDFAKLVFHSRKTFYVNCWHLNDYDSAAMWSIYAGRGSGIAITARYDSIQSSFLSEKALFAGKIIYSDYSNDIIDGVSSNVIMASSMRKRRSFEFEREFRILFRDDTVANLPGGVEALARVSMPEGVELKCDLSILIDEIYVSPKSEGWFLDLVQSVVRTYGLDKEVRRSALDVDPKL